ncbi:MAG: phenylalanine--tRNA ligase subunit beta [Gemmataceae bacterium]
MLVPLSWLQDYVDLPANPAELVERLTLAGLESPGVKLFGLPTPAGLRVKPDDRTPVWDRDKLLVARVLKIEKHPNADKLKLVTLDFGAAEPKTVVTGAPNIAPGQSGMKVVLGLRGTTYFMEGKDGKKGLATLEPKELRGVPNDAMCMSNFELGVADDHDGIIILDESDPAPGTPLQDLLGEIVVELDVLPNMARCLSLLGIAREVAALTGGKTREPKTEPVTSQDSIAGKVTVRIENPKLCGRYSATLITNTTIGTAPGWMQRRLHYAGMRPISNVVDVTNYVMLETGQPLHAFDYDKLVERAGGKAPTIIVRAAQAGETLKTLDGQVRTLTPDDLLIADTAGPIALAGVMGGHDTEVTDATKTILLESASFDFVSIRKTARKFNLFSEASGRFSRGVHPEIVPQAAARAADLLRQFSGGTVLSGTVDEYPAPLPVQKVELNRREIERVLGTGIPDAEVERVLTALQFQTAETSWGWTVTVPSTRLDIQAGAADLIEELARVSGYDRLPERLYAGELPPQQGNRRLAVEESIKDLLADSGVTEAITYSLTSREVEAKVGNTSTFVTIVNPLSPERAVLRRSLLPGLLEVVARNLQTMDSVSMFELGPVFIPKADSLPDEPRRLALVMTGRRSVPAWDDATGTVPAGFDFYDLKGVCESLLTSLHVAGIEFRKPEAVPYLHPGRSADIIAGSTRIGCLGELHPTAAAGFGLGGRAVLVAEFDLDAVVAALPDRFPYRPFGTFPAAKRDMAIVVPAETPAAKVLSEVRAAGGDLLTDAQLFDVYTGDRIPAGTKSLAFALSYQAADRTLGDKEIDKAHQKIEGRLRHMLKAQIRGKDVG